MQIPGNSLFDSFGPGFPITRIGLLSLLLMITASYGCASRQTYYPPRTVPAVDRESTSTRFTGVYHTVQEGQTLWRISKTYGVDLETLQWVNDVEDVTDLRIGRVLFIPGVQETRAVGVLVPEDEVPLTGTVDLIWPLYGRTTSHYGPRNGREHKGLDLAAPTGTRVKAAADGRVAYSGDGMRGYGKVVVVKHENDLSTVYAHNSKLLVRMGDSVKQGQIIARVGQTGWATGPHLHFEIRRRGVPEDPIEFLPEL